MLPASAKAKRERRRSNEMPDRVRMFCSTYYIVMHLVILHNDGFCLFRNVDDVNSTYHPFHEHGMIDIIPDIHGQLGKLESLLTHLGYTKGYRSWVHPERKVLFLGDYIDRGPQVRETLRLVRSMVADDKAIALMGNHELNAVAFHTMGADGTPLRPHSSKNLAQHKATLESFAGHEEELADYIEWFKDLPMFFEMDGLRAVHACWSEEDIGLLRRQSLHDRNFLINATTKKDSWEYQAVENVLKGPEITLPEGMTNETADGTIRKEARVRWWGLDGGDATLSQIAMPPGSFESEALIPRAFLRGAPNLPTGGKPVFFGHYWLKPDAPKAPLADGICCLDFSAGRTGPLVAYRWDGESTLSPEKFITAPLT
jgi:hypothetical protein